MDISRIWEDADWTSEARQIIDGLKKFPDNSKIILLLRHSQRIEPIHFDKQADLNLTPLGRKMAKYFGNKLPKDRSIRLFHSIVERCRNTAEEIFSGFKEIGGKAILKGTLRPLSHIGINLDSFIEESKKYNNLEIFNRWSAGLYSSEFWSNLILYSQNAAKLIWPEITNTPEKGIDIHVSHDMHILALRFGWFGLPPNNKWINYLGGFAFSFNEDDILLYYDKKLKVVEIPYWWKKT
ncbi:MAG: histidine phosphatase family protein [Promethearchaeota archaeon]